jgi:hypothetical protein
MPAQAGGRHSQSWVSWPGSFKMTSGLPRYSRIGPVTQTRLTGECHLGLAEFRAITAEDDGDQWLVGVGLPPCREGWLRSGTFSVFRRRYDAADSRGFTNVAGRIFWTDLRRGGGQNR